MIVTDRAVSQWVERMSGNHQREATENGPPDISWGEAAIVVKICRSGSANRVVVVGAGRGPAMHVRSPAS